ncbi:PAS domain-containing sensor histidine kinase [uncultured Pontibacter sp.]|uniref:PAS domain-containing protein n=1 Tax=uncultured Pontibacter sp. TaxID=453356 RepID=UPI00260B1794|nr:PAS domain-containing sensor histidine kinase [uncultured Pontibacter sp.]
MNNSFAAVLLHNLPGNFLAFTPDLQVLFASEGYARLIGVDKKQLEGCPLTGELPRGLEEYRFNLQDIAKEAIYTGDQVSRLVSGALKKELVGPEEAFCWRVSCKPLAQAQGCLLLTVEDAADQREQYRLQQEADRLHQLLNSLPGIVWIADGEGNLTYVNQAFRDLTGMSLQQAQKGEALGLVHPEDRDRLASGQNGNQVVFRLKARESNGDDYRWYSLRSISVTDENGQVVSRIGVSTDVHEQNKERLALKASGDKLREMLDALPIMAWAANQDGAYTYYNRRWWDYFNNSDEDWTLEQWGELMHPEDSRGTVDLWAESLATGTPYSVKLRWRAHKQAPYRWFHAYASPVKDEAGEIDFWMGATVDTHEQEEAQALLQEEKKAFEFLADVVPHMVWRTDAEGFHNYFNQRWVEYTGYDVESSLGTEMWNNLLHPEDRERARLVWGHSLETGKPYEIEYRFKRAADGVWRWFLARALPLRDETGKIVQWYGTCTDIEEKKHTERLLESQKQALELTNQDLDRFVHMIGHDLKLPLVNMGQLLEELAETGSLDSPDAAQLAGHLRRSHRNMTTTLVDLMELARLQRSAQTSATTVDLRGAIREVLESLESLLNSSQAEVRVRLDRPENFLYPKANLRSVLHNLLSNALKYSDPGRRPLIEIKSRWEEGFLVLTVADNGLGMDLEKDGKRLFGAFTRLHGHTEGSGLGLYIVKRIVELGGGRVGVNSAKGQGTVFTIKLPAPQS